MTEIALAIILLLTALQGGWIGFNIGRIRESNRRWTEVEELRNTVARQNLLLKMQGDQS